MPLLPELIDRYPALHVEIDFEDRRVDLVKDGYGLALRGGWLEDSSLVSRRICVLYTVLVASPDYLRSHGIPHTRNDLAKHRAIVVRFLNGKVSRWSFSTEGGKVVEVEPESPVLTVSAPGAAVEAAALGIGVAQVGVHHAWRYLRDGRLKVLLAGEHSAGERELALQYPHRALLAPRVRVTIEFLLEKLTQNEALRVPLDALRAFAVWP